MSAHWSGIPQATLAVTSVFAQPSVGSSQRSLSAGGIEGVPGTSCPNGAHGSSPWSPDVEPSSAVVVGASDVVAGAVVAAPVPSSTAAVPLSAASSSPQATTPVSSANAIKMVVTLACGRAVMAVLL